MLKGPRFVWTSPRTKALTESECPPGSGNRDLFSSVEDSEGQFSKCLLDTEIEMGAWLKQRLDEGVG